MSRVREILHSGQWYDGENCPPSLELGYVYNAPSGCREVAGGLWEYLKAELSEVSDWLDEHDAGGFFDSVGVVGGATVLSFGISFASADASFHFKMRWL